MLQTMRSRLRRNQRWLRWRRIQKEGLVAAANRRRVWSRILATPPIPEHLCQAAGNTEVHLLCWDADYLSAIWTLKSFYRFVAEPLPLVVHFQGRMTSAVERLLRLHLPGARLISQDEADASVGASLEHLVLRRIGECRRQAPFMQKLVDFAILARTPRIMILDADVLFFAPPAELFNAMRSSLPAAVFIEDPASCYNLSEEEAYNNLGALPAPRVNTGIVVIDRDFVVLERCEDWLANPDVARPTGYIEQTLYALLANESNCISYLPASYLVSLEHNRGFDGLVARHYAGPSRVLMTSEGMPFLWRSAGFPELVHPA